MVLVAEEILEANEEDYEEHSTLMHKHKYSHHSHVHHPRHQLSVTNDEVKVITSDDPVVWWVIKYLTPYNV